MTPRRRGGPSGGQDTAAERLVTHRQRRAAAGLKRVEEWVPEGRVPDFRDYARALREQDGTPDQSGPASLPIPPADPGRQ